MEVTQVTVNMQELQKKWGWFLGLGILITLIGGVAVVFPWIFTLTSVLVFGYVLIVSGVSQALFAFSLRGWQGVAVNLVAGVLETIVGVIVVVKIGAAIQVLTLALAIYLLAGGAFRIGAALTMRVPGAGTLALSGLISLVLGVFLILDYPGDSVWLIGTMVGVDLLFHGFSWIMLGMALRSRGESSDKITSVPGDSPK
jgi:uncharacterized membrane protein HdeD (DUF308 family)